MAVRDANLFSGLMSSCATTSHGPGNVRSRQFRRTDRTMREAWYSLVLGVAPVELCLS